MLIAGGLYREICETPVWNEELGSGGRAAAALAQHDASVELFTYRSSDNGPAIRNLMSLGVKVHVSPRRHEIVFAYFHPLSNPYIEPTNIIVNDPMTVSGASVLRFGFLEGSAVVNANRAVYDPQSSRSVEHFHANGSQAEELALVLNEVELQAYTGFNDQTSSLKMLFENNLADVVVLKRGIHGALVVGKDHSVVVPPYRSNQVFKIGTGDIFSALFAFHWGELRLPPSEAANAASKAVSYYCETRELPLPLISLQNRIPVALRPNPCVVIAGSAATLGRRYALEEARHCLSVLGVRGIAPDIDHGSSVEGIETDAVLLILADGLAQTEIDKIRERYSILSSCVILDEEKRGLRCHASITVVDFTTALYFASWS